LFNCNKPGPQSWRAGNILRRIALPRNIKEVSMRFFLLAAMFLGFTVSAYASDDTGKKPAGTAKGAAVGAVAGHEVGGGHAVAGAATGAAIGHHQTKKAEESKTQ
jgi:hypothetical protein